MRRVAITIRGQLEITAADLSLRDLEALKGMLTAANPMWSKQQRLGLRGNDTERFIRFWAQQNGVVYLPRGSINKVRNLLRSRGYDTEFRSDVTTNAGQPCPLTDLNVSLRPYQEEAMESLQEKVQGVLQIPCGGGKTTTTAAAMLCSGYAGMVIVHTHEILNQWVETINRLTSGLVRPRIIQGSHSRFSPLAPGEVAVAMVQTLVKHQIQPLLNSVGCFVIDEAHHAPSTIWRTVLNRCPARYRWGLTATPERSDGMGFALEHFLGPTMFQISTTDLIEQKFLVSPLIIPVATGWEASAKCDGPPFKYAKAKKEGNESPKRLGLIVRITKRAAESGRRTLVLVSSKKACGRIARALGAEGVTAEPLTSNDSKKHRMMKLSGFQGSRIDVLVATQLADEGLDLPEIDCMVICDGGKARGRALQRIGRSLRPPDKPVIFEMIDGGPFERQWSGRRQYYLREYGRESLYAWEGVNEAVAIKPLDRDRSALGF